MLIGIGRDDFRDIREGNYLYVDKSLMIQDFLESGALVTLITRPRRFGKTLNMTMLRDFFDITQDSKDIFKDLLIMKTPYKDQINTQPVIFITLKNIDGSDSAMLRDKLADEMKLIYMSYNRNFGQFNPDDDAYLDFHGIYKALRSDEVTERQLSRSLSTLIRTVSLHYEQKPLLIIDEYDQPLLSAHYHGFRDDFSLFFTDFLGTALKSNPHLGRAMLTGIQRVAKESIFSKLNNLVVYSVMSKRYNQYFGLTEGETKGVLESRGMALTNEVKEYYDGYSLVAKRCIIPGQ